jgi:membrane-associated phospholipid phosphatase
VLEIVFVLAISGLANVALKQVINRARPDAEHLVSVATLSYPSGHAMSAIAFYGFLIYLFYNFKLNVWVKTLTILILGLLILAIGISRIYLGVHYPSDIAGGYIAGFIWVIFCIVLFHVIDLLRKRRRKKSSHPE